MKNILACSLLVFCCSCAIKKLQRPTAMIDLKTGAKIKENSIHFDKGKICYLYSAQYDRRLFDQSIYKNASFSDFFPGRRTSVNDLFRGSASRSAKVDTVINNEFIVQMALQEALINSPRGFQYQYVPQYEFTGPKGNIHTEVVRNKFHPDIIINLKSVSLNLKGDVHTGYSEIQSKPGNVNYGLYSYSTTTSNSYGNILMDYTAVWEITDLKDHTKQSIRQTGRYVSIYYEDYPINEEVKICAKKMGKEFSSLFKNSYTHVY